MMNLRTLFERPYGRIPNIFIWAVTLLSFAGFLNASYLTFKRFTGGPISCPIFGGCDEVTKSVYSVLFSIPLSVYGMAIYLAVLVLSVAYLQTKNPRFALGFMGLSVIGFIFSVYFMYIQAFLIGAYCFYCVLSFVFFTTMFLLNIYVWKKHFAVPLPPAPASFA